MLVSVSQLIQSFSTPDGSDYAFAVEGIVFGNEFSGYGIDDCAKFTGPQQVLTYLARYTHRVANDYFDYSIRLPDQPSIGC